ncbi:CAMK family protein kinase [Tritrichomonas foetus]|uniref:CAMK family protein kinase n=1 Tax=Tritrichomonas foetus TaxID=1144522 RepID=A0A1J4JWN0_9EUKA|nr:CAMK family protein kinase [Tritrichomonas foetus]|eukprot:OHT03411.1 CAMK family protein kinase [Tritrichomonas foetus]
MNKIEDPLYTPIQVTSPDKIGPYLLKDKIGEGGFSHIRFAINVLTNQKLVCKIIPKRLLMEKNMESSLENEVAVLKKLDHNCTVHFYDLHYDTLNYYIMMEYCRGKTLLEFINESPKLSEGAVRVIFKKIAEAVKYIHDLGIVHRDLKPENILVNGNDVKLVDFGLAQYCSCDIDTKCGSLSYLAPEVLSQNTFNPYAADVWSLGIILYSMAFGHLPWTTRTPKELANQILRNQYFIPFGVSEPLKQLIENILNPNPEKRFNIQEILNSEWMTSFTPDQPVEVMEKIPSIVCPKIHTKIVKSNHIRIPSIDGKNLLKLTKRVPDRIALNKYHRRNLSNLF